MTDAKKLVRWLLEYLRILWFKPLDLGLILLGANKKSYLFSIEDVQSGVKKNNHLWFADKINIVCIRNKSTAEVTNLFDDFITITFTHHKKNFFFCWNSTTTPGAHYMKNLLDENGVAIIKPGQYVDAYRLGFHRNEYLALIQESDITVFRDNNLDNKYDYDKTFMGNFGINIHAPKEDVSSFVDDNSAGCVVFQRKKDFNKFISIFYFFRKKQNLYSLTLLESTDVKQIRS